MRENIDVSDEVIKILEHEAVDSKSKFDNFVDSILEIIATYRNYEINERDFGENEDSMNILRFIIQKKG